jgi:hypothetical protein
VGNTRVRWALRIFAIALAVTSVVVLVQGIVEPTDIGACNDVIGVDVGRTTQPSCVAPRDPLWPALLAGGLTAGGTWLLTRRVVADGAGPGRAGPSRATR